MSGQRIAVATIAAMAIVCALLLALGGAGVTAQDRPPDIPPHIWEQVTAHAGPPPQPQMLEPIGQIGGPTRAVVVQENLALIGRGPRVVILDVADPAAPVELGSTDPLPNYVNDVELVGNILYAAVQDNGLHIFDLADPRNPVELAALASTGPAHAVTVVGHLACLADGHDGLRVIDVTDPSQPALQGHLDTPGSAHAVAFDGHHAFVADGSGGLRVIDVSEPTQPAEIGALDVGDNNWDIAIAGELAYLADGSFGLHVVDVGDPTQPHIVGAVITPGRAYGVDLAGSTAVVASWWTGMNTVDISTPAQPVHLATHNTPGWSIRVAVSANIAYLADGDGGLRVVDVADPASPSELAAADSLGVAHEATVRDSIAYVAGSFSGLRIIDVADPAHPRQLAAVATHDGPLGGEVVSVALAGSTVLALDQYTGLHSIDISDPANPATLAVLPAMTGTIVRADELAQIAVVGQQGDGLAILDISDPANPIHVSQFSTFPFLGIDDVVLRGRIAYFSTGALNILDLSDPRNPTPLGVFNGGGSIALSGRYAYLVDSTHLRVVGISDPTQPVWHGSGPYQPFMTGVAAAGDTVYAVLQTGSLLAYDMSDPGRPLPLAVAQEFPDQGRAVTAADNLVYVSCNYGGLSILQSLRDKVTASIGSDGGLLASSFGETFLLFPSGAFTQPVSVTYRHLVHDQDVEASTTALPLHPAGTGHTIDVSAVLSATGQASQLAPGQSYTTLIRYSEAALGQALEESLKLHRWDGLRWVPDPTSVVYPAMNTVVAYPQELGLFALLGQTRRTFLPLSYHSGHPPFAVTFAAWPSEIQVGEEATLTWASQGAREAYLDGIPVPLNGSRQVQPSQSTTYVLRAVSWDGSEQEARVMVTVLGSPPTPTPRPTPTPVPPAVHRIAMAENRTSALIDGSGCQLGNGCEVFRIQVINLGNRPSTYQLSRITSLPAGWSAFFCWSSSCEHGNPTSPRVIDVDELHVIGINFLLPPQPINGQIGTLQVQGICLECSPQGVYQQTFTVEIFIPPTPVPTPTPTATPGARGISNGRV